jgi:hypothetical protein
MRVSICRIMTQGRAVIVAGNDVRKSIVEFQRGVQP